MKKIAFISTNPEVGGSELLWIKTAEYALKKEHPVCVSVIDTHAFKNALVDLKNLGAVIYYRKTRGTPKKFIGKIIHKIGGKLIYRKLYAKILDFKPDIICINQGNAWQSFRQPCLLQFIDKVKKPFFFINHSGGGILDKKTRRLAQKYFQKAEKVAFVAQRSIEHVERSIIQKIENAIIIRNPVNLTKHEIIPFPDFAEGIKMACVGRLNLHTKCYQYLLEALSDARLINENWTLSLFGEGEHFGILQEYINFYKLSGKVFLRGKTDDIANVWREHHLHIISSCSESAPISLVEAMLCGRPSIITNVGGMKEWVKEDNEGYVSENNNNWILKQTVIKALNNKDKWKEMGKKAHLTAVKMMGNPEKDLLKIIGNKNKL
jgi:glycosyltransferase involved in cell wall biosynthesis